MLVGSQYYQKLYWKKKFNFKISKLNLIILYIQIAFTTVGYAMVHGLLGVAPSCYVIVDDRSVFDFVPTSRGTYSSERNGSPGQAISHGN